MKMIEEIKEVAEREIDALLGSGETLGQECFVAGANWMRKELTKWNDPFVKDMTKDNVLVKYIAVGCPNNQYYTIGRREPSGWWDCENTLATSQPRFEIVGWRPIHE